MFIVISAFGFSFDANEGYEKLKNKRLDLIRKSDFIEYHINIFF